MSHTQKRGTPYHPQTHAHFQSWTTYCFQLKPHDLSTGLAGTRLLKKAQLLLQPLPLSSSDLKEARRGLFFRVTPVAFGLQPHRREQSGEKRPWWKKNRRVSSSGQ